MLIAQMSDMHVKRHGTRLFGHVDTAGRLEACVSHLNTLPLRPDAVLVTGDLTNDGDGSDYETLVARHPQVERLLCGHIHRPIQVRWGGTLGLTAPGTAHQVALGLAPDSPSRWIAEPPAVLLHLWRADVGLVTHLSYVGDYGAPMRFSDVHRHLAPE
ncbi:MAG: metallophosphoesterase [Candidatus Rokuibacteriota bacterium]